MNSQSESRPPSAKRPEAPFCPNCDSDRVRTERVQQTFGYGAGEAAVELTAWVRAHTCSDCGLVFAGSDAEDARHEAVCRHLGVMTPVEIRELRARLGFSRRRLSEISGLGSASLARWETGRQVPSRGSDRYLRLLAFAENVHRLEELEVGREIIPPDGSRQPQLRVLDVTERVLVEKRTFRLRAVIG